MRHNKGIRTSHCTYMRMMIIIKDNNDGDDDDDDGDNDDGDDDDDDDDGEDGSTPPCESCVQPFTLAHDLCHVVKLLFVHVLTTPTVEGLYELLCSVSHQTSHPEHNTHTLT